MVVNIQARMQELLEQMVASGRERGLQLAVYLDGELVVDAWAGVADDATGRPVDGQTLFPIFSTGKGITATLLHLLVERGQLNYDMPIAAVWPEFGVHGKRGITVRHALSHTAGLPNMPMGIGYAELSDWATMCAAIAQLRPISEPGTETCYHAITYSWLVGEVLRRVDSRPFAQLLHEEIGVPLGISDSMFIGIPDDVEPRVAVLDEIFAPGGPVLPDDTTPQSIPGWVQPLHTMMNRADARRACVPASSGIMTARALARHYAALLPGGVDGVELLPPDRVREATQPQRPANDPNAATSQCFGLGYGLNGDPYTSFGHGGYGGSNGYANPTHRLAVGLTKNLFSPNAAHGEICQAVHEALGIPQ
ncbi:MAG TPA: serine hydrolase domain-containing protein, partial [Armatimonadota bacterium]|jgi:CubicO group peptidase (beta-lactamase class C family)